MDYLETNLGKDHDYDSTREGTNRFATILLYLDEVEDGGETTFVFVDPDGTPREEDDPSPEVLE